MTWMDRCKLPIHPGASPDPLAVQAWNMMGGQVDWSALPIVAELLGLEDIEHLINQLVTIRDHGHPD